MAEQTELLREAYQRGILPPEKRALFEEAQRRGLFGSEVERMPSPAGQDALDTVTQEPSAAMSGIAQGIADTATRRADQARQALTSDEAPAALVHPTTGKPIIKNADGSVSTERSITVEDGRLNGGKPTNIPTIWDGTEVSPDQAIERAAGSGQQFPSFNTVDEAVAAAKARSAQLGKDLAPRAAPETPPLTPTQRSRATVRQTLPELYQTTTRAIAGRNPNADYESGTDLTDQLIIAQSSTVEEALHGLRGRYGWENVTVDAMNRPLVIVNNNGNPKIVQPGIHGVRGFVADLYAKSPAIAGAGMGAIAGFGAAGPPGAILGAGIGGLAGGGLIEIEKALTGRFDKDSKELFNALADEFNWSMAGQAGGEAVAKGVKAVTRGGLPRWFTGATPETESLTALSLRYGVAPPVRSFGPSMKATQFHQSLAEKIMGPFGEKKKLQMMEELIRDSLHTAGVKDVDGAVRQVMSATPVVEEELGLRMTKAVQAHAKKLDDQVAATRNEALRMADDQVKALDAIMATPEGAADIHQKVAEGIMAARQRFSNSARHAYTQIDVDLGGASVVPMSAVKKAVAELEASLPHAEGVAARAASSAVPPVYGPSGEILRSGRPAVAAAEGEAGKPIFTDPTLKSRLQEIQRLPDMVTFGEAQQIRTNLRELGLSDDLTPGPVKHHFRELQRITNDAFSAAAENPEVAPAVKALRATDKWYREGIREFDDRILAKVVRDAQRGLGQMDPEVLDRLVVRSGFTERTRGLLKMLPADTRASLAEADWTSIRSLATNPDGTLNPTKLDSLISARGKVLDTLYGPNVAGEIRSLREKMLAISPTLTRGLNVEQLQPGQFKATLQALEKQQREFDGFMDKSFLRSLSKPGYEHDQAVSWAIEPGHVARLKEAVQFYGEQSSEIVGLREAAVRRVLQKAIDREQSGAGVRVSGKGLIGELDRYSATEQKILFPSGLDEDLRTVAQLANFWFPPAAEGSMAAGLAAGAIKMALPFGVVGASAYGGGAGIAGSALVAAGAAGLWGWLLSTPGVVRYLALGLKGNETAAAVARASMTEFAQSLVHQGGGS